YQNLSRTWNFFPKINEKNHGVESYQQFCISRHEVLKQYEQLETDYPAATAIGSKNNSYCFVFLFSKHPGKVIENNRQVSAWQYPLKYSPKQPTFSRAIIVSDLLICSGTASVVGHETHHENNFSAQFDESLANVEAIVKASHCNVQSGSGFFKFYVRSKKHLPQLTELIKASVIDKYVILLGDICRTSLLLECEAVFQLTNVK
ncbi:MAG: pteridine-dependent deoxygenase like protein, partial [Proteobacteria bacterium]|nr:pteridine-dependent deoxygenase like protein [Pseudomonadota bacterium]